MKLSGPVPGFLVLFLNVNELKYGVDSLMVNVTLLTSSSAVPVGGVGAAWNGYAQFAVH